MWLMLKNNSMETIESTQSCKDYLKKKGKTQEKKKEKENLYKL